MVSEEDISFVSRRQASEGERDRRLSTQSRIKRSSLRVYLSNSHRVNRTHASIVCESLELLKR